MKKCPFCAEEIQDEAIKCKHCGEFFEKKVQSVIEEDQIHSIVEHDTSDNSKDIIDDIEPDIHAVENEKKHKEVNPSHLPSEKKSKYGWGWFVLVFIFSQTDKTIEAKSIDAYYVKTFGWFVLLFFYFWFRRKLINSNRYSLTKTWKLSFFAGFATYILLFFMLIIVNVLDRNQSIAESKAFFNEFQKEKSVLNDEEKKFYDQLIAEPSSESDLSHNIALVKNYLTVVERKRSAFNRLITYMAPMINKTKDDKLIKQFEKFKILASQNVDLAEASMSSLLDYYVTSSDESYEKYEVLVGKSAIANEEFKNYSQKFMKILNEKNL